MSALSSYEISAFNNVDPQELVALWEQGRLESYLYDLFDDQPEVSRDEMVAKAIVELKEAIDFYRDVLKGKRRENRNAERSGQSPQTSDTELEELESLIDSLRSDVYKSVREIEQKYARTHLETDEDVLLTATEFDDGDVVSLMAMGGKINYFDAEDEEGVDRDGDGFVTYQDEQVRQTENISNFYDLNQDIIFKLGPDDVVELIQYERSELGEQWVAKITVSNEKLGKTVTFNIDGLKERGVHLIVDVFDRAALPPNMLASLPDELQKLMYIGDDFKSVYENRNPLSAQDKLTHVESYDEVKAGLSGVIERFVGVTDSLISTKAQAVIDRIYTLLNDQSVGTGELWGQIVAEDLADLSGVQRSQVLAAAVFAVAIHGGEKMFQRLFSGGVPGIIENALASDGSLSRLDKLTSLVLEEYSGGAGLYSQYISVTTGEELSDARVSITHELWNEDLTSTRLAFEDLKRFTMEMGWAPYNTAFDHVVAGIAHEEHLQATGTIETLDPNDARGVVQAIALVDANDAKDGGGDGINTGNYYDEVTTALNIVATVTAEGGDVHEIARRVIAYLQGEIKDSHDGDVVSGFIYYLQQAGMTELLRTLITETTFGIEALKMLQSEDKQDATRITEAYAILEQYQ